MDLINEIFDDMVNLRRTLHMYPEIAFKEEKTAAIIKEHLKKWDIPFCDNVAETGIVAWITGKQPGKTLAFRADMDGLPIREETGLPFQSRIDGMMHACGHDAHVAILLGTAYALKAVQESLHGEILLIFQPAEEDAGGAEPVLEHEIFKAHPFDTVVACHVWPKLPVGRIALREGVIMAAPDDFDIEILGKGGHGAQPELLANPITAAAELARRLESELISAIGGEAKAVMSVCYFNAGNGTHNIVPDTASLGGTVRTVDIAVRNRLPALMNEIISGIIEQHGCSHKMDFIFMYPPVLNHPAATRLIADSAEEALGAENIVWSAEPSMGGDDFSFFAQRAPGCYFHVGAGGTMPLHNNKLAIDERCIHTAMSVFYNAAIRYLAE